ncbi:MAG TPA: guanylate kinase [Caldisericia bacterium]|nr:guanylate kinase [Caldisericia bacterium]HPF48942.1 guanylate kinase [Caldisericia bacterium]HPI83194.1 guanylate kinase [Caldisericia bacterium]HRV74481.1 guanylate kinase [Caldisericia bacterium]
METNEEDCKEIMGGKGTLFVLSGPSGAGKTTVEDRLTTELDLFVSISMTTRPRRANETDGIDYLFTDKNNFNLMVSRGEMLEWANVHGNLYGTPREPIEKRIKEGKDSLLVIDIQGANQIRRIIPSSILIFLLPPSIGELRKRLMGRNTDSIQTIDSRLEVAQEEIASSLIYDYSVVNHNIAQATIDVACIIMNCTSRRKQ